VLETLLDTHVREQRDYHHAKARRLTRVHHNLDQVSEWMFRLAVVSVALFLGLQVGAWMHWVSKGFLKEASYIFTFLGVLLPTFGGAIAGVRYFGDFERFAAISEVTAQKLDSIHARIALLMKAPDSAMDYGPVAELAHAADDVVVSEIENWQAVFGGKHITVPV
jgi:ABC-type dipeptide/oligopeptide/nickel transport system permease component